MSDSSFAEIASLFQDSLIDLTTNDRWQIGNLTMIAKEHIEAAQEISTTLEAHIKNTAPNRKLPALYVLDSIVKNTGSPYTIYLGRNLYSTFMDAYTLVDGQTRRAMDSMLRTWQKPLTTMDNTPVFPVEATSGIDAALTKAMAILQRGQPQGPPPYRGTPPPQMYQNGYHRPTPPLYNQSGFPPPPNNDLAQSILSSLGQQRAGNDTERLQADISNLIASTQQEFARNVYDVSLQQRLQALLDLQNLVRSSQLPPETMNMIKAQVSALAAAAASAPASRPLNPVPQWQSPPPQNSTPFAPGALDALLAATGKPATPALPSSLPIPPPPSSGNASSLIDALRAAGLAPNTTIPPPPGPDSNPAASLLRSLTGQSAPFAQQPTVTRPRLVATSSSMPPDLKIFRPAILSSLYESQPTQCSTCARRFAGTDAGRAAKAAHLDWHFRTNQRIADAAADGRAQYRKFYLDEMPWITLPNFDPSSGVVAADLNDNVDPAAAGAHGLANGGSAAAGSMRVRGAGNQKDVYVTVPAAGEANTTCPVCQEPFTASWHDGAQEWVWMDAVWVAGKVVHASCNDEVSKISTTTTAATAAAANAAATATATAAGGVGGIAKTENGIESAARSGESSLGKRKAEDVLASLRAKLTRGTA